MDQPAQPCIVDENPEIKDNDRLPINPSLTVLRYRTIKKNNSLGWWSAAVLLEDHGVKQACFYRWRKNKGEWKRDKKLAFRTRQEWETVKSSLDAFANDL